MPLAKLRGGPFCLTDMQPFRVNVDHDNISSGDVAQTPTSYTSYSYVNRFVSNSTYSSLNLLPSYIPTSSVNIVTLIDSAQMNVMFVPPYLISDPTSYPDSRATNHVTHNHEVRENSLLYIGIGKHIVENGSLSYWERNFEYYC